MGRLRPRIAVVFDQGSTSALELTRGLGSDFDVTYVLGESAYAEAARVVFRDASVLALGSGLDVVADALAKSGVEGVVTFSERMVMTTSELSSALRLRGHSVAAAHSLTSKAEQRAVLEAAGLSTVRFARISDVSQWPAAVRVTGLPAVVKPVHGESSRNTFAISTHDEGSRIVRSLLTSGETELIVENLLAGRPSEPFGDYVSVESSAVDGVVTPYAVTGKWPLLAPFREVGHFWPSALPADEIEQIHELTVSAIEALGVRWGLVHTEVKLTPTGPQVLEVNGRVGGLQPDLANRAAGLDLVRVGAHIALGHEVGISVGDLGRVYFQFRVPTPTTAARYQGVTGVREAMRMAGVSGYKQLLVPGDCLVPAVSTRSAGVIVGDAASHEEMFGLVDGCLARLRYTYVIDDREEVLSGTDLMRRPVVW